jgi:uncharacterized repeat protein (TIGR03803 family)
MLLKLGTTACAAFMLYAATTSTTLSAQTITMIESLNNADGAYPFAGLVQATNGEFYGTTYGGGANLSGAIFKVSANGSLTLVYSFCSETNCTDGALPRAGLMQDSNGNLYGAAEGGGTNNRGTVFTITPAGRLTVIYDFCNLAGCADGAAPYGGLVQASNGSLVGTTESGGQYGFGSIFSITPAGSFKTLYSFCASTGCPDGASPSGTLVQAANGVYYGTTQSGGKSANCGAYACGTVFKFTGAGALTTLHSFCVKSGCADGQAPYAGLTLASDGNFYGTTPAGGANANNGTVFKITPAGKLTTLYNFCSQAGCADGQSPNAGLIQATDGNLYGATSSGGAQGYGSLFGITLSGALTTLHSFDNTDGAGPDGTLVQGTNGDFYGTTSGDGASGYGTVFGLSVGLGAFIETLPTSGKVGAAVKILGTGLTGANSVTFNGVAAVFTVVSSSEITTTVPTGVTTGPVRVRTSAGTFTSNSAFRVP